MIHFVHCFRFLVFFVLTVSSSFSFSQLPAGAWRDHLPYRHGKKIAEYNGRIFCLTVEGSLYSYNDKEKDFKKHSKVSGLSDAEISTIGSSEDTKLLLIGYSNGNIDFIRNDSVINIPDIKRKLIIGEKSINHVYFLGNYAYLSTGFGIVVCDVLKSEIKETYLFGPGGSYLFVNDITSDGRYLYAATRKGIFRADLNNPNLVDFNAWIRMESLPDPEASYSFVAWYNNTMFTIYTNPLTGFGSVITFNETEWQTWPKSTEDHFGFLQARKGNLIISGESQTWVYTAVEELERQIVTFLAQYVFFDSENNFWYAASYGGLAKLDKSGGGAVYAPEGSPWLSSGDITVADGNVWIAGGNYQTRGAGYGAYSFIDEKWKEYNGSVFPEMREFYNITEIAIDPLDKTHILGGSYGYGLVEFKDNLLTHLENENDGVLKPVIGYENIPGYMRITGVGFDKEGNMYASGSNANTAVYKKPVNGQWAALDLDFEGFGFEMNTGKIMVDHLNQIWLLLHRDGIVVFTENNLASDKERFFAVKTNEQNEFNYINCIAEDHDGNIWVGTNKGPVIYDPSDVFSTASVTGYQPAIPRGDGYISFLLASEVINDIAVDGANRKWIATARSGVFLVSPDGKKELKHFTEENSPLLSNTVITVGINDRTGEVFFGTEKGIIAYMASATEGGDNFGDVYVFPNPVREDFTGDITVTGLASNVNVKITDIAGNLVYETTSLGGQALWNGRNFNGDRVHTGVYLVFCSNEDGSKTFVTKLLFIH